MEAFPDDHVDNDPSQSQVSQQFQSDTAHVMDSRRNSQHLLAIKKNISFGLLLCRMVTKKIWKIQTTSNILCNFLSKNKFKSNNVFYQFPCLIYSLPVEFNRSSCVYFGISFELSRGVLKSSGGWVETVIGCPRANCPPSKKIIKTVLQSMNAVMSIKSLYKLLVRQCKRTFPLNFMLVNNNC